jgi:hypothetical protein
VALTAFDSNPSSTLIGSFESFATNISRVRGSGAGDAEVEDKISPFAAGLKLADDTIAVNSHGVCMSNVDFHK